MLYELFAGSLEDMLLICKEPQTYNARDFIYRAGPPALYYVHSGVVRTYHVTDADGLTVHHDFFPKGTMFGETCLWPDSLEHHAETAVAQPSSVVSHWTATEFQLIAQDRRELVDALVKLQAERHRRMLDRIERAETLLVQERIHSALIETAYRIGWIEGDMAVLPPISHEVIGSMVGTHRSLVTKQMNLLRRAGFVRFSRKELLVFRLQKTQEAAA
jgi:CRP/FNR family transcriptional regulator, cyclic AMP receptor protein